MSDKLYSSSLGITLHIKLLLSVQLVKVVRSQVNSTKWGDIQASVRPVGGVNILHEKHLTLKHRPHISHTQSEQWCYWENERFQLSGSQ